VLSGEEQRSVQLRRFRQQLRRGVEETAFYGQALAEWNDPGRLKGLGWEDLAALPVTTKQQVREQSDSFVRRGAPAVLSTTTTGTTGRPTKVSFTHRELRATALISALSMVNAGVLDESDIVQVCTSSRASLGNGAFAGAVTEIGAVLCPVGLVDPDLALRLLTERRRLPGRSERVTVLDAYPSYVGQLVERGTALGLGPDDFGLRRIMVGGELVTAGLKRRCQALFGPVCFEEGYGMTETWPIAGACCEAGHVHFEPLQGLVEVLDLDSGRPAEPGQPGTIVATPFAPFREATVVLRYDTQDVTRVLTEPAACTMASRPATGPLLGKAALSIHTEEGWVFPRDVLEPLEDANSVPLPARVSLRAAGTGVEVAVVVRDPDDPGVRADLRDRLATAGVPLSALRLVDDVADLDQPLPWRCDLRELSFPGPAPERDAAPPDSPVPVTD
jgi:phenylacetate-coenzyme A ligase PaaK-like adenylate-forming protein